MAAVSRPVQGQRPSRQVLVPALTYRGSFAPAVAAGALRWRLLHRYLEVSG